MNLKKIFLSQIFLILLINQSFSWELSDCWKMTKISKIRKKFGLKYFNGNKIKCIDGKGVFNKYGKTKDRIRYDNFHDKCLKVKNICKDGFEHSEVFELEGAGSDFLKNEVNSFDWKNGKKLKKSLWSLMQKLKQANGV